ncbi:MAG: hypothetical protein LBS74_10855 [Oscillospiraceae bacterium]|jgi:hypothetical protein|nr:hypothetical protein [Oscillospiraceae bacterium]
MEYTIISGASPKTLCRLAAYLVKEGKLTLQSFIYPYVDSKILAEPQKSNLYFYNTMFILNDFLSYEDIAKLLNGFKGVIGSVVPKSGVITARDFPLISERQEGTAIIRTECEMSFEKGWQVRKASRELLSLAEIAFRIILKHGGLPLESSGSSIRFLGNKATQNKVFERLKDAGSLFPQISTHIS